ncbi:hypothetical protein JCM9533A_82400 [Catenuloplanes niger JCM 9533]
MLARDVLAGGRRAELRRLHGLEIFWDGAVCAHFDLVIAADSGHLYELNGAMRSASLEESHRSARRVESTEMGEELTVGKALDEAPRPVKRKGGLADAAGAGQHQNGSPSADGGIQSA